MTREQRIEALRFDFQDRVTAHCLERWTLTHEEASELLQGNDVALLLPTFAKLGNELKRLREERMVYASQDDALDMLAEMLETTRIAKENEKARWRERFRTNLCVA
jgi:hypothetical protein